MIKKSIYILGLGCLFISCTSQEVKINAEVRIVDENKNGLPEAQIKMYNSDTTIDTKADLNGLLGLKNIRAGTYKLDVEAVGYYKLSAYAITLSNAQENLKIEMIPASGINDAHVEWSGGWVTIEEKNGEIKCVRSK